MHNSTGTCHVPLGHGLRHCWACAPASIHALPPSWTCPCQHSRLASPLDPPVQDAVELTPGPSLVKAKLALTPHSLDRLLSYHDDNTKEAAFEVALFAEMFLEMLQVRGTGWGGAGASEGVEQGCTRSVETCAMRSGQLP